MGLRELAEHRNAKLVAYALAFGILGMVVSVIGVTIPGFASEFQVRPETLEFLFFFRGGSWVLSSLLWGYLYDKPGLNAHVLLTLALIFTGIGHLLTPVLARSFGAYGWACILLVVGLGGAGIDVGVSTLLGWVYGKSMGPFNSPTVDQRK